MPLSGPRLSQINAAQQQRQLFMIQHDFLHRAVSLRPTKSPAVQLFRTYPKPAAVIYDQLQAVAPRVCEEEDMPGERLLLENGLHRRTQTVETSPHVVHAGGDPDPRPGAEFDHWRRHSRIERNSAGSAPPSTRINAMPGNSMWIVPTVGCRCSAAGS
jgi:hypothetical protein